MMAAKKCLAFFIMVVCVSFVFNYPAESAQVSLNYSGIVDQLIEYDSDDGTGSLGGVVNEGDFVSGSFTYDSALGTILAATMKIGTSILYDSSGGTAARNQIFITDSSPGDDYDAFATNMLYVKDYTGDPPQSVLTVPTGVTYDELNSMAWQFSLYDLEGTIFSDESIPDSLNLIDFDLSYVSLRSWFPDNSGDNIANGAWFIRASVPTIPEPSTFLLLGGGLAGLVFVARRRKKE
jgi:hypothetical protein